MAIISTSDGRFGTLSNQGYTPIGRGTSFTDLARLRGQFYGISVSGLYRLNGSTGASSFVGGLGQRGINGLAFDTQGRLYGTGDSNFYRINLSTGAATTIASINGFDSSGDVVFVPARRAFFATSATAGADDLFRITPGGRGTRIGNIGFEDVFGLTLEQGRLFGYTDNGWRIQINPNTGQGTLLRRFNLGDRRIYGAT